MTVGVLATLKVIPEKQSEFELAFSRFQSTVRTQEKGCVFFCLHKSREVVGDYVVMEQYVNDDALVEHRDTEHYKALPETMSGFLAAPPVIEVFDSVK